MIKRRSDEPDDKALERLRQFEQQRKPVPDMNQEEEAEQVDEDDEEQEKKSRKKNKEKDKPDKATDQL